jgi:hypothetical protein
VDKPTISDTTPEAIASLCVEKIGPEHVAHGKGLGLFQSLVGSNAIPITSSFMREYDQTIGYIVIQLLVELWMSSRNSGIHIVMLSHWKIKIDQNQSFNLLSFA